jgi:hypothetical protein
MFSVGFINELVSYTCILSTSCFLVLYLILVVRFLLLLEMHLLSNVCLILDANEYKTGSTII